MPRFFHPDSRPAALRVSRVRSWLWLAALMALGTARAQTELTPGPNRDPFLNRSISQIAQTAQTAQTTPTAQTAQTSPGRPGLVIDPAFSAWRPDLEGFASADKLRRPEQGGVLFVGSSTIRLWRNLAQDFRQQPVIINRGFGGSTLAACNFFAKDLVVQHHP